MKIFVNMLSIFRIFSAFLIVPLLLEQLFMTAFIVFVAAAMSDWLDGFLARRFKVQTKIGGVLDHMGDKFLVVNALVMMIMFLQIWWVIAPAVLMICRNLYVSGLREFMGTEKMEMPVPKDKFALGKVTTFLQMGSLALLLLWIWAVNADWDSEFLTYHILFAGVGGLSLAAFFSIVSAVQYTSTFVKNLKKTK